MARRSKKERRKRILRLILSLTAVLAIMAGLATALKHRPDTAQPTAPVPESNPYTAEDFGYDEQGYLTCLAGESIPGIDVSSHQGIIDWPQVKAAGIEFVFIRLGYRGYDSGTLHADELALSNLQQARAAGLQVGAYFFSQALNEAEALEEAQFALSVLEGITLDLPLAYDWEYVSDSARTGAMEPDALLSCVDAFCGEVEQAGFQPMVYFNQELSRTLLELSGVDRYPFWLAMYDDRMTFPYKVDFWQYSDRGQVPGIEGYVDLNLYLP